MHILDIHLDSLLEQLNIGVFRATSDGQIIQANTPFLRILGLNSLTQENASFLKNLLSAQTELSFGEGRKRELQLCRTDGNFIWILLSETLNTIEGEIYIDGLVEDISDRKRTEETLKRYSKRLQTLQELDRSILQARSPAEIAQAGLDATASLIPCQLLNVTLFDFEQNQVTLLAAQSEEGIALNLNESFAIGDWSAIEQLQENQVVAIEDLAQKSELCPFLQKLVARGIRFFMNVPMSAEGRLIGSLNVGAIQPQALEESDKEITYEIANQLAIAIEQYRLREALQGYTEQLKQEVKKRTQELEELNSNLKAFTYSVSHDLREPLRALQLYAQILSEDHVEQLDPMGQTLTSRILVNAERMDALVQDLLTYSHLSRAALVLQPINLGSIFKEVLAQLKLQLWEKKAQITLVEPLGEVIGHYPTLIQIITNLVTNAIKFVAPDVQPQVRIYTEKRARWLRLWVEDNGIGIEPQYYKRIFQVFERLHSFEVYPGTGAGLAIVRKGVERMGGRFGVESDFGQGSRFWIELLVYELGN